MILFLKPYFEVKPWAGEQLNKLYDCPQSSGEAWIISAYKNKSSIIVNGEFKGQSLFDVWNKYPYLFNRNESREFPLLIKLISSKEKLSVQVHPDDEYALKKHNSLGKFECWYILPETKAKFVTLGLKVDNVNSLSNSIKEDYIEEILIQKEINKSDLIIVEPGTVHAINEDTFLLEVQESSDITYRLFDYNRLPKRELHVEDALNVIKYDNKNSIISFEGNSKFENNHFRLYKYCINDLLSIINDSYAMIYVLDGNGTINGQSITKGNSLIVTNNDKNIKFEGKLDIIVVFPPIK